MRPSELDPSPTGEINEGVEEHGQEKIEKGRSISRSPSLDAPTYEDCQNAEQKKLWLAVNEYVKEASQTFHDRLVDVLVEYQYGSGEISDKILIYLERQRLIYPNFTFRFGKQGKELLKNIGLADRAEGINPDQGVLIFQLPKPLKEFWWKSTERVAEHLRRGGKTPGLQDARPLEDTVIEWGKIYDQVMPAVWGVRDQYEAEGKLFYERLNQAGEHDPDEYYYVWIAEVPKN